MYYFCYYCNWSKSRKIIKNIATYCRIMNSSPTSTMAASVESVYTLLYILKHCHQIWVYWEAISQVGHMKLVYLSNEFTQCVKYFISFPTWEPLLLESTFRSHNHGRQFLCTIWKHSVFPSPFPCLKIMSQLFLSLLLYLPSQIHSMPCFTSNPLLELFTYHLLMIRL